MTEKTRVGQALTESSKRLLCTLLPFAKDETLLVLYSHSNCLDELKVASDVLVGLTNQRLFKYDHGRCYANISLSNVKEVRHQRNGLFSWDKLELAFHDGRQDAVGIYEGSVCETFVHHIKTLLLLLHSAPDHAKPQAVEHVHSNTGDGTGTDTGTVMGTVMGVGVTMPAPVLAPANSSNTHYTTAGDLSNRSTTSEPITHYALRCSDNKWYVGRTSKTVAERLEKHKQNKGAAWTRKHPPLEVVETRIGSKFMEDVMFFEYVERYGIANVRGGSYVRVKLPRVQMDEIKRRLQSANFALRRQPGPRPRHTNTNTNASTNGLQPKHATDSRRLSSQ